MVLLGSAAAACPLDAFAQSSKSTRRIGVVMAYTEDDPNGQRQIGAFKERLTTLGWIEGNNITVDVRYAGADPARARELATELLQQRPDLMVSNSNLVTAILQKEVRSIPLVFIRASRVINLDLVIEPRKSLGHAPRHEANNLRVSVQPETPNHRPPRTIWLRYDGILGDVDPIPINANAIVTVM